MLKNLIDKLGFAHNTLAYIALANPESNLVRFAAMRTIAWLGFLGLTFFGVNTLNFDINLIATTIDIFVMLSLNIFIWLRLNPRSSFNISDLEYLLYLIIDIIGLVVLFYYTGGANNPFIFYFLVPLTISAATLPALYTWILALTTVAAYSFLLSYYHPVEIFTKVSELGIQVHVLGMWLNFLLSVVLITIFIVNMASVLRQRERDSAALREKTMYDEQIMTIATQAAGTAHELGTPLATMAIVLNELQQEYRTNALLSEDLALLRQQVDLCKSKLHKLVNKNTHTSIVKFKPVAFAKFISKTLENWQALYPNASYDLQWKKSSAEHAQDDNVYILSNLTLEQAIVNLLNNAWTASAQKKIKISLNWDKNNVYIEIYNTGTGIPVDLLEKLGKTIVSSNNGLGLGLFLTNATINRQNGTVKLYNHPQGGTLTEVSLPRTQILAN